jgi:hypothetical protein
MEKEIEKIEKEKNTVRVMISKDRESDVFKVEREIDGETKLLITAHSPTTVTEFIDEYLETGKIPLAGNISMIDKRVRYSEIIDYTREIYER